MPTLRRRGRLHPTALPVSDFEFDCLARHGLFYRDHFLPVKQANVVRSRAVRLSRSNRMKEAGMGRGQRFRVDSATRGDQISWLERSDIPLFTQRLEHLRVEFNKRAFLGLKSFQTQLSFHRQGSPGYKKHRDTFRDSGSRRVLTAIFYLNVGWKPELGGQLRIYPDSIDISPTHNRLVVFLAELEHEVLPVQGQRLALTTWFSA